MRSVLLLEREQGAAEQLRVSCEKIRGGFDVVLHDPFVLKKEKVAHRAYQIVGAPETAESREGAVRNALEALCQRVVVALRAAGGMAPNKEALRAVAKMGAGPLGVALLQLERDGRVRKESRAFHLVGPVVVLARGAPPLPRGLRAAGYR